MAWIKRNLFFVIGAVIALALMVGAGIYNFSGWKHNAAEREKLNEQYEELKRLYNLNPHPGFGKVDNVKTAREQQKEIHNLLAKTARTFERIPPIPAGDDSKVSSGEFTAALRRTIDRLTREATAASVVLPADYRFSFFQQFRLLNFAPGSLEPLAVQLGEVKALTDVLLQAKVNAIESIQRERVSADDLNGPQTDYIDIHSQTNELAVLTPYAVTFRSFTPEIALVLAGFANSPHGLIVKGLNVELVAPAATTPDQPGFTPPAPAPVFTPAPAAAPIPPGAAEADAFARRYGTGKGFGPPTPTPTPAPFFAPPVAPAGGGRLPTVLNERQLKVTMLVEVVKLKPRK